MINAVANSTVPHITVLAHPESAELSHTFFSEGLIIDTPGMRELQIWADSSAISKSFDDVETLASLCKFSDCQHTTEPHCAITKALATGQLTPNRLNSYYKLLREVEHLNSQQNAAARAEKKQGRKKFARLIRNRPDKRE